MSTTSAVLPADARRLVEEAFGSISINPVVNDHGGGHWDMLVITSVKLTPCKGYPTTTLELDCIPVDGVALYSLINIPDSTTTLTWSTLVDSANFDDVLSAIRRICAGEQLEPVMPSGA